MKLGMSVAFEQERMTVVRLNAKTRRALLQAGSRYVAADYSHLSWAQAALFSERELDPFLLRWGVSLAEVKGVRRTKRVAAARRDVACYLRLTRRWSFDKIGDYLNRHHSSIMHLCSGVHATYEATVFNG